MRELNQTYNRRVTDTVFIAGATGFMGRRLCAELVRRGHAVRALVRRADDPRLPAGVQAVVGDAMNPSGYVERLRGCGTFVQLVGVAHPNPARAAQFRSVDGASAFAAIDAAAAAGVRHFIYVSVAQPAPIMKAYVAVRAAVEDHLRASGIAATILRPWYVLGPGRRWPMILLPAYWLLERIPATREAARRLGFVSIGQMAAALVAAVEAPPASGARVWDVPVIRHIAVTPSASSSAPDGTERR